MSIYGLMHRSELIREVHRRARSLDVSGRALPSAFILGAQKAGTTSLHAYLAQDPHFQSGLHKEVHFFDHNFHRGVEWYRSNFPRDKPGGVTCDSSPFYLLHPLVPSRLAGLIVRPKLVAILRNPIDRAYSHFQHSRAFGHEPIADFGEAVEQEGARTDEAWVRLSDGAVREEAVERYSYVRRGLYVPQISRWREVFHDEDILLITMEEMQSDPARVVGLVRDHIGLDGPVPNGDWTPKNSRSYAEVSTQIKKRLGSIFTDDIHDLEGILQRPTHWAV